MNNAVLQSMAREKCLFTTPSLLSKATRSRLSLLGMRHQNSRELCSSQESGNSM